jgi:glycine/D-amino acid oxidase-like deaminating enzyme
MNHQPTEIAVRSLWAATATPAPELPRLESDVRADVAIVGGGYSGLSAALTLQQRGIRPVVLDAHSIGWAASGRNGGVVSAKFRVPFPEIAKAHGLATAKRMHHIAHEAVDVVEELIGDLGIEGARFERSGALRCAHTKRALEAIAAEGQWLRSELGDNSISVLGAAEVAEETGSPAFVGGVLTRHSGSIHPLSYVRGLARGLVARGVEVFEHSAVQRIRQEAQEVSLETATARVRARQVIIATDAYSDLTPATRHLRPTIIPFRSAIIATEPLPPGLEARLMRHRHSCMETRRMMKWFRKFDGRMLFGGRGAFGTRDSQRSFSGLRHAMTDMFPDLAGIEVEFQWSGFVGMTLDQLPHVGRLDDRTCVCLGYNGAGVAMASLLGRYAAMFAAGHSPDVALLDASRLRRLPFYPLRAPGIRTVAGWYQLLDALGY